jgi:tripartite-type tricarboxylate transporter receptor subunit TctC
MSRWTLVVAAGAFIGGVAIADPGSAQPYPIRPVKIVVPFAAGGPVDLAARSVFERVSAKLKQPFVIENRVGAGGNVGTDAVVKAPADGYTLLFTLSGTLTSNPAIYKKLPFNVEKDLRPISLLTSTSQMLVVNPSVPASTLAEFVAYARKEPLIYAHAGAGSSGHLAMEYFRTLAGFETVQVPYRGNAPLVIDLVTGQVKVGFVATAGVVQHVRDGKLRGLAISAAARSRLVPEVPTAAEAGYSNFRMQTYFVLLGPAGLADGIADLIEHEVREAMRSPDVENKFRQQDITVVGSNAAAARAFLREDTALWARIAKDANLRVD